MDLDRDLTTGGNVEVAKLAVVCDPNSNTITNNKKRAIIHAIIDIFHNHSGPTSNEQERKILIGAAFICFSTGLICTKTVGSTIVPDGEWRKIPYSTYRFAQITAQQQSEINNAISSYNIYVCTTLIAATKINWYKENCHTGQEEYTGYVKEVVTNLFDPATGLALRSIIDQIGQWSSTRAVLIQLGLANVCPPCPVIEVDANSCIKPRDDIKSLIKSNPAGTTLHFIAFEMVRLMFPTIIMCPGISDFSHLYHICSIINKHPALYHVKAEYLCEGITTLAEKIEFFDEDAEAYLGRIGTFGNAIIPNGILMQALRQNFGNYQNAPDYSVDYEIALSNFDKDGTVVSTANLRGVEEQLAVYLAISKVFGKTPLALAEFSQLVNNI
ncbi:unnamed protein product [Gordionus sp. m RMFG-2023]